MYTDKELTLRPIVEDDLYRIWELIYKDGQLEWKKWDAPYYPHHTKTYEQFLETKENWIGDDSYWAIEVEGVIRGTISYYWEHEASKWLEMGIALQESQSWGKALEHVPYAYGYSICLRRCHSFVWATRHGLEMNE